MKKIFLIGLGAAWLAWGGSAQGGKEEGWLPLEAQVGGRQELVYYVWEISDGRVVPSARGFAEATCRLPVPATRSGPVEVRWQAVGLSGWTAEGKMGRVEPQPGPDPGWKKIPWEAAWVTADGVAGPKRSEGPYRGQPGLAGGIHSLTLEGKTVERWEWLKLTPEKEGGFPWHFCLQVSLGPEGPWFPVPSADFVFFPDPGRKEVWIPLRGLMARCLRIGVTGMRPPERAAAGEAGWALRAVEILGGGPPRFGAEGAEVGEVAAWNNLWLNFGLAGNEVHQRFDGWWETDRPLEGGMVCIGSTEWLGWGARKLSWLGADPEARRLEEFLLRVPREESGLLWASPDMRKHLNHSVHYVNNAIYPSAVAHHYLFQRDRAFLDRPDSKTGETILAKARRAMDYQLEDLGGWSGLVTYPGEEADGTPRSRGTNYWDIWLFGHECAYGNALFYESLGAMVELEEALGETKRAKVLRDLLPVVRERYQQTFWNAETGRMAGWVDREGRKVDYGFTFVNAMALAMGLPTEAQADSILAWLDGKREVAGDTSKGADIYHFGFVARANTLDAFGAAVSPVQTWNGALDLGPGGNGAYGEQIQNGGGIFYVSYYDLHGRRRHGGEAAVRPLREKILAEVARDQLRRRPANAQGSAHVLGLLREFPESGLVPYFFVDGILGVEPVAAGLRVSPLLPRGWKSAVVEELRFAGQPWKITATTALSSPRVDNLADGRRHLRVPATGRWLLGTDGKVKAQP
ncbi:hypothetical protein EBS57_01415 [bacterium]|nr:hypothetical protein [bacterium]